MHTTVMLCLACVVTVVVDKSVVKLNHDDDDDDDGDFTKLFLHFNDFM